MNLTTSTRRANVVLGWCFLVAMTLSISCSQPTEFDSGETTETTNGMDTNDPGQPWETPLQELEFMTFSCSQKIPGFENIAAEAQETWKVCFDSVTPEPPVLKSRSDRDEAINASVYEELDKVTYMAVCRNTSAYKSCWTDVNNAISLCEPGKGDVAGMLYFALYDEICREGGRITVENRRKAAQFGRLCTRNYSTPECRVNSQQFRRSEDLCMRFRSNTVCDISSVDPNCANHIDKTMHAEIFERVGNGLHCSFSASTPNGATAAACISIVSLSMLTLFYLLLYIFMFKL